MAKLEYHQKHHLFPLEFFGKKNNKIIKLTPDQHVQYHLLIKGIETENKLFFESSLLSFLFGKFDDLFKN